MRNIGLSSKLGPMPKSSTKPKTSEGPAAPSRNRSNDALLSESTGSLDSLDLDDLLGPGSASLTPGKNAHLDVREWFAKVVNDDQHKPPERPQKVMKLADGTPKDSASGYRITTRAEVDNPVCTPSLFTSRANVVEQPPAREVRSYKVSGYNASGPVLELAQPNPVESAQNYELPSQNSAGSGIACAVKEDKPDINVEPRYGTDGGPFGNVTHQPSIAGLAAVVPTPSLASGAQSQFPSSRLGRIRLPDIPLPSIEKDFEEPSFVLRDAYDPMERDSSATIDQDSQEPIEKNPPKSVANDTPNSDTGSGSGVIEQLLPKGPSKTVMLKLGINKKLSSLRVIGNRPAFPSYPVTSSVAPPNRLSITERVSHKREAVDDFLFSPSSRTLSAAFALTHPTNRPSALKAIFETESSAAPVDTLPEQLRKSWDTIESKLNNDPKFRQDSFRYLTSKMDASYNGESSKQGGKTLLIQSPE